MRRTERVVVHPQPHYNTRGDMVGESTPFPERCRVEPVDSSSADSPVMHATDRAFRLYFKGARAPRIDDGDVVVVRGVRCVAHVLPWPTAQGAGSVGGTVVTVTSREG